MQFKVGEFLVDNFGQVWTVEEIKFNNKYVLRDKNNWRHTVPEESIGAFLNNFGLTKEEMGV